MNSKNLQQLQDKNYLTTPQISEGNSEQQVEGKELVEATVSELHSEHEQEVEQENLKPSIKPQWCVWFQVCPGNNNPLGCWVCG